MAQFTFYILHGCNIFLKKISFSYVLWGRKCSQDIVRVQETLNINNFCLFVFKKTPQGPLGTNLFVRAVLADSIRICVWRFIAITGFWFSYKKISSGYLCLLLFILMRKYVGHIVCILWMNTFKFPPFLRPCVWKMKWKTFLHKTNWAGSAKKTGSQQQRRTEVGLQRC